MNQNESSSTQTRIQLSPRIAAALETFRRQVWRDKMIEAALEAVFGLVVSFLLVFILDRLIETPWELRALILLLGSIGCWWVAPLKWYRWIWKRRQPDQVARLVRNKQPRLGDELLGIVELTHPNAQNDFSPRLVEAAMQQMDERLKTRSLSDAAPDSSQRFWKWATAIPSIIVIGCFALAPDASWNALARWGSPWRAVERYTFVQPEPLPEILVTAYAESWTLLIQLKENSPWKPDTAMAQLTRNRELSAELDSATAAYVLEIPPLTQPITMPVRIGDFRSVVQVTPKPRPELKSIQAEIHLPDYLQRSASVTVDARSGTLTPVEGSELTIQASTSSELRKAWLDELEIEAKDKQLTSKRVAGEPARELVLNWEDVDGLQPAKPQVLRLEPQPDQPPLVGLSQIQNNLILLSTETLAFEVQASDDFGIRSIGLEWQGIRDPIQNPEPAQGKRIIASGAPEKDSINAQATFSPERDGVAPQSVQIRAYALDYQPDREPAYSALLTLHILAPAEHLKWLTDQLEQWSSASREVFETELQLNRKNLELSIMDPKELETAEMKEVLKSQAAAEQANAARLEELIGVGKQFVQEGTRNEEFSAGQLGALATTLQELEEIAGRRMPSVAELLSQASNAPVEESTAEAESNPEPPAESASVSIDRSRPGDNMDSGESESDDSKSESPAEEPQVPGAPNVADVESGFNPLEEAESEEKKDEEEEDEPKPAALGALGLPTSVIKGSGTPPSEKESEEQDGENKKSKKKSKTSELTEAAVEEQKALLEAFSKLSGEMKELLQGFEETTFVKRLKAASRRQLDIADEVTLLDGFGLPSNQANTTMSERDSLKEKETGESKKILTLLEDMMAYNERQPSDKFIRVMDEMQQEDVMGQLENLGTLVASNRVGVSMIEAEYWADNLDRYAEQLVDPLDAGDSSEESSEEEEDDTGETPSLTPEIVLEVIRVINQEIELRESTRETHQLADLKEDSAYYETAALLSQDQSKITDQTWSIVDMIEVLPDAEDPTLQEHANRIREAAIVMGDVQSLLAKPETGAPTQGAIAEVLEILLQTVRQPNTPPNKKAPAAVAAALALMGVGDDSMQASIDSRAPSLATGRAGRKLPEEFQQGLDQYFSILEGTKTK